MIRNKPDTLDNRKRWFCDCDGCSRMVAFPGHYKLDIVKNLLRGMKWETPDTEGDMHMCYCRSCKERRQRQ